MNESQSTEIMDHAHDEELAQEEIESARVSPIPVLPQLSVALGLLVFVFGITYVGATHTAEKQSSPGDTVVQTPPPQRPTSVTLSQAFGDVSLRAQSAIVWDVRKQRVLFNKNADDTRPLASITKLMTALVARELLDPKQNVSISKNALDVEGDSGFSDGETFTVQNLTDLTLISSSNDGAAALGSRAGSEIDKKNAEQVFVEAMNVKADELGLFNTHFANSTGLDVSETEAGAYGSARDVALLMEYIITNFKDTVSRTTVDTTTIKNNAGDYHTAKNTNDYTSEIEGLIASKTGYTNLSGGNLVVAVNMGLDRPIIVTVLGSTQDGRFTDTLDLVNRARTFIEHESDN